MEITCFPTVHLELKMGSNGAVLQLLALQNRGTYGKGVSDLTCISKCCYVQETKMVLCCSS